MRTTFSTNITARPPCDEWTLIEHKCQREQGTWCDVMLRQSHDSFTCASSRYLQQDLVVLHEKNVETQCSCLNESGAVAHPMPSPVPKDGRWEYEPHHLSHCAAAQRTRARHCPACLTPAEVAALSDIAMGMDGGATPPAAAPAVPFWYPENVISSDLCFMRI